MNRGEPFTAMLERRGFTQFMIALGKVLRWKRLNPGFSLPILIPLDSLLATPLVFSPLVYLFISSMTRLGVSKSLCFASVFIISSILKSVLFSLILLYMAKAAMDLKLKILLPSAGMTGMHHDARLFCHSKFCIPQSPRKWT
jgi:hypothetical protein